MSYADFITRYNTAGGVGVATPAAWVDLEALAYASARRDRVGAMLDITAGRFCMATETPGERVSVAVVGRGYVVGPGRIIDAAGNPSGLAGCDNAAGCPLAAVCMRADPRHKTRFDTKRPDGAAGCRYAMPCDPARYRAAIETTNG